MDRRKRYFDFRLYVEKIKQLRMTGILMGLSFLAVVSIVSVLGTEDVVCLEHYICSYEISLTKAFIISYLIITPILTLCSFHYLMVRKSCDFYHAIPHTRTCQFLTGVLALATYILVIVLGGSIVHGVIQCFYMNGHIVLSDYAVGVLGVIIANLLVMSSVILACSVSGTMFQTVIFSLIIIVIPRCLIGVVVNIISQNLFFVNLSKTAPFLTDAYSFVVGLKYNDFSVGGMLYTTVLTLIYLVFGGILFHRRKSELAEVSKPGAVVCAVFRILAGFSVSLVFVYIFLEKHIKAVLENVSPMPEKKDMIIYSACILAVFFVYFLIEFINNRGRKKFLRLIPGILAIFFADFIVILLGRGVCEHYINFRPEADEIEYVKILAEKKYDIVYGKEVYGYFGKKVETIKLQDSVSRQVISSALNKSIDMCPDGQGQETCNVLIHTDGKDYYRTVYLNDTDRSKLMEKLLTNKEYLEVYKELPDIEDINIAYYDIFEKEEAEELYQILLQDFRDMEAVEIVSYLECLNPQYQYAEGNYYADTKDDARKVIEELDDWNSIFSISTHVAGQECTLIIPGEWQAPENFYKRYVQMINDYALRNGLVEELKFSDITGALIVNMKDADGVDFMSICSDDTKNTEQIFSELDRELNQQGTSLKELMKEENSWSPDSPYIRLTFEKTGRKYYYFINFDNFYMEYSDEEAD